MATTTFMRRRSGERWRVTQYHRGARRGSCVEGVVSPVSKVIRGTAGGGAAGKPHPPPRGTTVPNHGAVRAAED
jgi:hypothetical protein